MVYNEQPQERIAQYTGWFTEITSGSQKLLLTTKGSIVSKSIFSGPPYTM